MLQDRYGRTIDYLRLSVIDHCNLRCVYCMPLRGLRHSTGSELLTPDEIECVVRAAADLGFRKVRLTGGEPTLRAEIVEIVWRVAAVAGIEEVAMTTNGVLLPRMIDDLVDAGLKRVNLHIDTLNPDRFERLMRFGTLREAWAGLEAALYAGLSPIKINSVVTRGFNDEDVVELAALTLENDWHVRFIELMPLGGGECADVARKNLVTSAETQSRIEAALGKLTPVPRRSMADESVNYRLPGALGEVGFISPVSEPYCGGCNRMRLTADGKFHLCLLHDDEIDVRSVLRSGGGQVAVEELLRRAVEEKPIGHRLAQGQSTMNRNMIQVGG